MSMDRIELCNQFGLDPAKELIHFIWIGTLIEKETLKNIEDWKSKFPGTLKLWVDSDLELLPAGLWADSSLPPAQRADYLRVWVIYHFGGWYIDADCKPGRVPLIHSDKILFAREDSRRFTNCFFFAPANSKFLLHWNDELIRSRTEISSPNSDVSNISGPGALSRALYTYLIKEDLEEFSSFAQYLGWSKFTHLPGNLFKKEKPILFYGNYALHFGKSSWNPESKLEYSSHLVLWMKQMLYLLRHSNAAVISDFIRCLYLWRMKIQNRNCIVLPRTILFRILKNVDLTYLNRFESLDMDLDDRKMELGEIVRRLEIMVVKTRLCSNATTLSLLKWEQCQISDTFYFIRPRLSNYLKKLRR